MKRGLAVWLWATVLAACTPHPTDAEKRTVSELTTPMSPHGLGRYLIDLPPTWRFGSGDVTLYYGLGTDFKTVDVTVIDTGVTPAQFQAAVAWRTQHIQHVTNDETYRSMLVGSWPVDVRIDDGKGSKGRDGVLLRYYDSTLNAGASKYELHLLLDNVYVQLTAKCYEGARWLPDAEPCSKVEDRLKTLARQIFLVNDLAYTGPGFILGPIVIEGPQDHEQATIKFYDPQRRDITLGIDSNAVTPDAPQHLLQRSDEGISAFKANGAHIHTLFSGHRAFAGMQGEEVRVSADSKAEDGTPIHELLFFAETYRPDPGLMKPTLSVTLDTGLREYWDSDEQRKAHQAAPDYLMNPKRLPNFIVHVDSPGSSPFQPPITSSLTDAEGTAIWGAILPTIRQRPGAVAPLKPKVESPPPISREQAERDRQTLDAFLASRPDTSPNLKE